MGRVRRSRDARASRMDNLLLRCGAAGTVLCLVLLLLSLSPTAQASNIDSDTTVAYVRSRLTETSRLQADGSLPTQGFVPGRRLLAEAALTIDSGTDYLQNLGYIAAPGLVLSLLSLFGGMIFGCCRCCSMCGGGKPTRLYTSGEIRVWVILHAVVTVLVVAGFVAGVIGNSDVASGTTGFLDGLVNVAEETYQFMLDLETILRTANPVELKKQQDSVKDVRDRFKDVDDFYNSTIEPIRNAIVLVSLLIPLFGSIFVILSIVAKVGGLSSAGLFLYFVGMFLCWLLFSVHVVLVEVLQDTCHDVDALLNANLQKNADGEESIVAKLGECPEESQEIKDSAVSESLINIDYVNRVTPRVTFNRNLYRTGTGTLFQNECQSIMDQMNAYRDSVPDSNSQDYIRADLGARQANAAKVIDSFVTEPGQQTCPYVKDMFNKLRPDLCGPLVDGSKKVAAGTGVLGITVLVMGVLVAAKGVKRFGRQDPSNIKQPDDLEANRQRSPQDNATEMQALVPGAQGAPPPLAPVNGGAQGQPTQQQAGQGTTPGDPQPARVQPTPAGTAENSAAPAPLPPIQPATDPNEKARASQENEQRMRRNLASLENEGRMRKSLASLENEARMKRNLASLQNEDRMKKNLASLENEDKMKTNLERLKEEEAKDSKQGGEDKSEAAAKEEAKKEEEKKAETKKEEKKEATKEEENKEEAKKEENKEEKKEAKTDAPPPKPPTQLPSLMAPPPPPPPK